MKFSFFPANKANKPGVYPIFSKQRPSDEFSKTVCDWRTPVNVCELCGRVHFDLSGGSMEEGELDKLLENRRREPKKYVGHDGQIDHGCLGGKRVVHDCPCNGLFHFEQFVWSERLRICDYYNAKTKTNLKNASRDAAAAVSASTAVRS